MGLCLPERKTGRPSLEDERRGENWDHVAFDPQHRLVLEVVPGKRHQRQRRRNGRVVHLEPRLQFKWQRRTPGDGCRIDRSRMDPEGMDHLSS